MSPFYLVVGIFLASPLFGTAVAAPESASQPADIHQLIDKSSFVFAGTVKALKASTMAIVPATESTAVVHVDDVVYNAGVVTDVLGHDITVRLATPGALKKGEHAVFFSNVDTYGESIVVGVISHFESTKEALETIRGQIKDYQARLSDERLQERIAQADLIVTGTITAVRPTAETQQRPPVSEHDPRWWEVTLRPESIEKGPAQKGDVTFYFPNSDDVRWFGSPKFKAGQQGVFLLHRSDDATLGVHGLTALNALDSQTMEQRATVQKLIRVTR
jgi:hypothetical protein